MSRNLFKNPDSVLVDYLSEVTNKPYLGALSSRDVIDYNSTDLINKPIIDSGGSAVTAGSGLTLSGSTISVNAAQPTITSVGTLTGLNATGAIVTTIAGTGSAYNIRTVQSAMPIGGNNGLQMGIATTNMNSAVLGFINNGGAGSNTNQLFMGLVSAPKVRVDGVGVTIVESTQASTSTTTGSLRTGGGFGCAGAIYAGGVVNTPAVPTLPTHLANKTYVDAKVGEYRMPPTGMPMTSATTPAAIEGITYTYTASSSSANAWLAADGTTGSGFWTSAAATYDGTGAYVGTATTAVGAATIPGEWWQVQTSTAIKLNAIEWFQGTALAVRYAVLGSNDGTTWTVLLDQTGADVTFPTATNSRVEVGSTATYTYHRLVINKSNTTFARVTELKLMAATGIPEAVVAGTGLTKTGNTLAINAAQPGITSLGTLTGATVGGNIDITGYRRIKQTGGNSSGYTYGAFTQLGDGIHLGYNAFNDNTGWVVQNAGGGTTRVSFGYSNVVFYTGGTNSAPTDEHFRVAAGTGSKFTTAVAMLEDLTLSKNALSALPPTIGNHVTNKTYVDGKTWDYNTSITNKPTLGALAAKNTIDWASSDIVNKPGFGTSKITDLDNGDIIHPPPGVTAGIWSNGQPAMFNGVSYTATASSSSSSAYNAFDRSPNDGGGSTTSWDSALAQYNTTTGAHTGGASFGVVGGGTRSGQWVYLTWNQPTQIKSFWLAAKTAVSWSVCGLVNGVGWHEIDKRDDYVWGTDPGTRFTPNIPTHLDKFFEGALICITKLKTTNSGWASVADMEIRGTRNTPTTQQLTVTQTLQANVLSTGQVGVKVWAMTGTFPAVATGATYPLPAGLNAADVIGFQVLNVHPSNSITMPGMYLTSSTDWNFGSYLKRDTNRLMIDVPSGATLVENNRFRAIFWSMSPSG